MCLTLSQLIKLAGSHLLIHGIAGLIHVQTSAYVNYNHALNYIFMGLNGLLTLFGVLLFILLVVKKPGAIKGFAVVLFLLSLGNFILGIMYLVHYFHFYANCMLDRFVYYTDIECWIGPDYPTTFWHVITILMVITSLLFFLYAICLCKLAPTVCCMPPPCIQIKRQCAPRPCCKRRWYHRFLKVRYPTRSARSRCPPPCPPPCPPLCPPPCPPLCPPPCPPQPCPPPCPPPCSPCSRKTPKFILTLKPGRTCK